LLFAFGLISTMQFFKNTTIHGANDYPIAIDVVLDTAIPAPVVIYAHGFNGFKDWGNMDIMAERFAAAGFVFVKFNFSHNGTSVQEPEEFVNLEAFGNNNYSKQLEDLDKVIAWVANNEEPFAPLLQTNQIYLIGHSMGGGMSILKAANDPRIKKLITWAAISVCKTPWGSWSPETIAEWKATGVAFYHNGRTGQQMPLYYQLYEDYEKHAPDLDIVQAMASLQIPVLICHGTSDTAVSVESAILLQSVLPTAQLFLTDSDHVFGRKHPWLYDFLPEAMEEVVQRSIGFLKEQ